MNILMIHKFYYIEGGAERYVFNLSELLHKKGDHVIPFSMQHPKNFPSPYSDYFVSYFNPEQLRESKNPFQTMKKAARVIYNREAQRKLSMLIEETRPDIAHVHSVYHHISPAILKTLKDYNIPVILTCHDFKLVCPNIVFLDGKNKVCEACQGKYFWKVAVKKCFRNSYGASLLVAMEASFHYLLKSYKKNVDLFHAPSAFLAKKMAVYGYENKPIRTLPYTLDVQSFTPRYGQSDYFVYAGRMSVEKGVLFLVDAMQHIKGIKLFLIGTGPLDAEIQNRIKQNNLSNVQMLGYKSGEELRNIIANAAFTVMPSLCHDNSPLAIYESLSLGNAILGSRIGGIPELIEDGVDGYVFTAGDTEDFVKKVNLLINNPITTINMGKHARRKAELLYTPDEHYSRIMDLYEETIHLGRLQ